MNVNHLDVIGYKEDQLKKLFDSADTLSIDVMVNTGNRKIDKEKKIIFNDTVWKGFFPVGHVLNFFSSNFHAGFKKEFFKKGAEYRGITSDSDGYIKADNTLEEKENDGLGRHILLKYTGVPWRGFYDIFKIIDDKLIIGKAFMGMYPYGKEIFTFPMVRKYTFDDMTVEDHRELFANAGRPEPEQIEGVWDMAAVSNNNHRTGVAKLAFDAKPDGRIEGRYQFMNLIEGATETVLSEDELRMYDFTPLHDEIRSIDKDYMIGKWCSADNKVFKPLSAGLIQVEPTDDGLARFCFYYTLKRTSLVKFASRGVLDRILKLKLGVGLHFDEKMVGPYCEGKLKDPQELKIGKHPECQFNVRITIKDLDEFVASKDHQAELTGTIQFEEFNGESDVISKLEEGSHFNYLRLNPDTDEREMNYHIRFSHKGDAFLFEGTKFMQKDNKGDIKEILDDYTTLYCRISRRDGNIQIGAAKLKFKTIEDIESIVSLLDFAMSFKVTGTTEHFTKVRALNKFNAFTLQFILDEYNPVGL